MKVNEAHHAHSSIPLPFCDIAFVVVVVVIVIVVVFVLVLVLLPFSSLQRIDQTNAVLSHIKLSSRDITNRFLSNPHETQTKG